MTAEKTPKTHETLHTGATVSNMLTVVPQGSVDTMGHLHALYQLKVREKLVWSISRSKVLYASDY